MRVLVVGAGAREHALCSALARNPVVDRIYAAPGNAGMREYATLEHLSVGDIPGIAEFCERESIDLTVVGPEMPLVAGLADELLDRGLPVFGPTRDAAMIEGSKTWARELCLRHGIPGPLFGAFTEPSEALEFLDRLEAPFVVKADGLAAGKGVTIAETRAEAERAIEDCLVARVFGDAGARVVLEEHLTGIEVSAFAMTDGKTVLPLTMAQDYKRALDGDRGPNTGGMGAYSPLPFVDDALAQRIDADVLRATVAAMEEEGIRYQGVLYAGLMLTADGPKVLEFNARFGDPETQVVVPRLESNLGELMLACVEGNLAPYRITWKPEARVGVVMASGGYPGRHENGKPISGLVEAGALPDVEVFHSGTALREGRVVTAGGRVLTVSAGGPTLDEARGRAYEAVEQIGFDGAAYRTDIAAEDPAGEDVSANLMDGQPVVGILVGNSNHLPLMQQAGAILERFGVPFELQVMSPHRSPDLVDEYSRTAESRGILAIICGAAGSGAGGLAGAVAARTALPVIGVPIASETLGGADALYSAVQMPRGVPVGTMAVNGAVNAAVYAAQIVGVGNPEVRARLHEFKESLDEECARDAGVIPRYTLPEMASVWSEETKLAHWLRIEVLAVEGWARIGQIPEEDARVIRERAVAPAPERVEEIEAVTHHDVAAFVQAAAEPIGDEGRRWLHFGLTSSDILDTALALQMRDAADVILRRLERVLAVVVGRALEHRDTICVGRTHGVHAEPTTFGHKLALWAFELDRDRDRLRRAREAVSVGKLSGVVGTYSQVDPRVEEFVCGELGLRPAEAASQVVQRDVHAEYVGALALTAATLEKIALEIRHLARTEVREVEEPFSAGQKGSSAMPHKRNPILCERICGLARVVRANQQAALEDVALWHERDISHSSVERVILPDSTIAVDYMLSLVERVAAGLRVFPDRMRENLDATGGLIFSQGVLLALVERGLPRDEAYAIVQDAAARGWDAGEPFRDVLWAEVEPRGLLSREEFDALFDPAPFVRHLDGVFSRLEKLPLTPEPET